MVGSDLRVAVARTRIDAAGIRPVGQLMTRPMDSEVPGARMLVQVRLEAVGMFCQPLFVTGIVVDPPPSFHLSIMLLRLRTHSKPLGRGRRRAMIRSSVLTIVVAAAIIVFRDHCHVVSDQTD